ncbi:hypothetical protein BH20ACT9_BH20ACT9_01130 [soil metagenome]
MSEGSVPPGTHATPGGSGLRAADADRERTASALRDSFAQGRLDMEEFSERLDAVYAARTTEELHALVRDLPTPPVRPDRLPADPREGREDGLAGHVARYLAVMALLVAVWALTGAGYFWPVWPMLGWGIGLLSHAGRARAGHCFPAPGGYAPDRAR